MLEELVSKIKKILSSIENNLLKCNIQFKFCFIIIFKIHA